MFFYFKVSSKDVQVLEKFVKFLSNLETSPMILKYFSRQKKRKFVTILKSPHVNKTAQEQFEFRFYSREFLIDSLKPLTFFLVLKKIKNVSFPGLKLEVKSLFNILKKDKSLLKVMDPDNIVLNSLFSGSNPALVPQKKYIQLFDCYGESYLKNSLHFKVKIQ